MATAIEYGLIAASVAVVAIIGVQLLGPKIVALVSDKPAIEASAPTVSIGSPRFVENPDGGYDIVCDGGAELIKLETLNPKQTYDCVAPQPSPSTP